MKKFLLSLAALAAFSAANAEEIKLNANDAKEIDGTLVEETKNDDGSVQAAKHYQPLLSLELGDFTFTFEQGTTTNSKGETIDATASAYYYPTSTSTKTQNEIRIYKGNTMTITAPAGTKIAKVAAGTKTLYEGEGKEEIAYSVTSTVKISTLTITTGEGSEPPVVATAPVELTTTIADGKYAIACAEGVAKLIDAGSNNYGYSFLETVTIADGKFSCPEAYLLTFKQEAKGWTILDSENRYWGMDATHFGSFNLYDNPDANNSNCYWNIEFVGNDVKITNATRKEGAYISYKKYNNDWELATTDKADQALPQLYKATNSAIETVEVENADAPVEYFNLQGVRVANPENGLYIRRQGNKVEKVVIR